MSNYADRVPSIEKYFMSLAVAVSKRSPDPSTKVGAVIVDKTLHVISTGYNDFPLAVKDKYAYTRDGDWKYTKYPYITHAEANAILHAPIVNLKGCTLYVTMHPCNECAKMIVEKGIKRVVYMIDKYHDQDSYIAARDLLRNAKVETRQLSEITVDVSN